MKIRTLERTEVSLHRQIRLRALRDAPTSFAESVADAETRPLVYWESLTESVTSLDRHVMFLACEEDAVYGCTYGLLDRSREDGIRVGGMWVDPTQRQRGIGKMLLEAVLSWGLERRRTHFGLWVPTHQEGAIALYKRAGFVQNGLVQPLPNQPQFQIMGMEKNA